MYRSVISFLFDSEIKEKLSKMYHKSVSTSTISRHLHKYGYKNVLLQSTHMLTSDEKERRIQWTENHKNDDFTNTIFTDESSFQLFRNTVRRWTKNSSKELKCSPKNSQKVHIWGGGAITVKGVLIYHTFRCNLDGPYYASILEDYLIPAAGRK
jgi:cobalamin biosynthesis Co2+ chelatase CbiK